MSNRQFKFRVWDDKVQDYYYFGIRNTSGYLPSDIPDSQIQPYTGLDDSQGIHIYEGDILCFRDDKNKKYLYGEVFWSKEYLTYCVKQYFGTEYMSDYLYELMLGYRYKDIVVAGNIFENPELLDNNKVL